MVLLKDAGAGSGGSPPVFAVACVENPPSGVAEDSGAVRGYKDVGAFPCSYINVAFQKRPL